jgi:uncharacterized protein involved in type VI secretion and phage assembly
MTTLFDADTASGDDSRSRINVAVGVVTANFDLPMEGKVKVRIPAIDEEVWARLAAPGAGSGAGFFYVPRVDDEVLVVFANGDPMDPFVIGGLWNDRDSIPISDPVNAQSTRILRTGLSQGTGHEIELDDLLQSVTIKTSTDQKITMDPTMIELTNMAGTTTIKLDNTTQSISIKAAASLSLEAPQITIKGATVEINGTGTTTLKSTGICNVTGSLVKIN